MKYVIVVALLLSACGNVPSGPPRPMTVGECMWSRGASSVFESGGGSHIDYYALQSCEAEVEALNRKRKEKANGG